MALEIEGKVIKTLPEQQGTSQSSGKSWRKAAFVIETLEQYPKKVVFNVWNNNVDSIKNLKPGEKVKVNFRIESREYNERWYTDLTAWSITKIVEQNLTTAPASGGNQPPVEPPEDVLYDNNNTSSDNDVLGNDNTDITSDDTEEDLPF